MFRNFLQSAFSRKIFCLAAPLQTTWYMPVELRFLACLGMGTLPFLSCVNFGCCVILHFGDSPCADLPICYTTVYTLPLKAAYCPFQGQSPSLVYSYFGSAFSASPKTALCASDKSFGAMTVPIQGQSPLPLSMGTVPKCIVVSSLS